MIFFMAQYLDSHQWASAESTLSFRIIETLQSIINTQFGGDGSVHIGFIYIAVGLEAGQFPRRFIVHIPFYNPTHHGYNFSFACPFTFARGFAGVASSEYYLTLQDDWGTYTKDILSLAMCSPISITEVEVSSSSGFKYHKVKFTSSPKDAETITAGDTKSFECWMHGPTSHAGRNALDAITDAEFEKVGAAVKSCMTLPKGSQERAKKLGQLKDRFLGLMTSCRSASYPTMQISLNNPMDGHVPFPVNTLRLSIDQYGSGAIDTSDRTANDVHIVIAPPTFVQKFISFNIVWDRVMLKSITALGLEKNKKKSARYELEKVIGN